MAKRYISLSNVIESIKEVNKINSTDICRYMSDTCTVWAPTRAVLKRIEDGKIPKIEEVLMIALSFDYDIESALETWKVEHVRELRKELDHQIDVYLYKVKKGVYDKRYKSFSGRTSSKSF